jgi:hypothetical protein
MQATSQRPAPTLDGHVLAHCTDRELGLALEVTRAHPRSGVVLCGGTVRRQTIDLLRCHPGPKVFDAGDWRGRIADPADPFGLRDGALVQLSLDEWAAGVAPAFTAVLTPSGFVPDRGWHELDAVLEAADAAHDPRLVTLVPTDAAMLESLDRFVDTVAQARRRIAVLFAAASRPLARVPRAASLRELVATVPGAMVVGCEAVTALDALTYGAAAAGVGVTSSLRQPRRPGDPGARFAFKGIPGMFLRDLWEHRSPTVYADWYLSRPQPSCDRCPEARTFESWESTTADKAAICRHNIHTWLSVLDELDAVGRAAGRSWLAAQRRGGLDRHLALRPYASPSEFDLLLRQYAWLDGLLPTELRRRRR